MVIFLIIPSVFASSNLGLRTNIFLVIITIIIIIFITFFSEDLPGPLGDHFHVSNYYYYSIPVALMISLVFLNYFAIIFGTESRLRKEALNKLNILKEILEDDIQAEINKRVQDPVPEMKISDLETLELNLKSKLV